MPIATYKEIDATILTSIKNPASEVYEIKIKLPECTFLGGVMNLIWIAAIAGFVLLEKLLPPSLRTVPLTGSLMVVIGLGFIAIG